MRAPSARGKLVSLVIVGLLLGGVTGAKLAAGSDAFTPKHPVRADPRNAAAALTAGASGTRGAVATGIAVPRLSVPRAATPITVDGELDEPAWSSGNIARTGAFGARPYSDARLAWRDDTLYLVLYAADEDLRATDAKHDEPLWLADSVRVTFTQGDVARTIEVSPAGVLTDYQRTRGGAPDLGWESGAKIALDLDGTLNQRGDNDEEWVVEMAVPLRALGVEGKAGERVGFTVQRCDLSREEKKRACAEWGAASGEIVLADAAPASAPR